MPPPHQDLDDPFAEPLPRASQPENLRSPWSASSQGSVEQLSLTLPSIGDLAEQPSLYERLDPYPSYQPERRSSPAARSHSFNIFPAQARTLHAQRPQPIPPINIPNISFSYGNSSSRDESDDPFESPVLAPIRSPVVNTRASSFIDLDDIVDLTEDDTAPTSTYPSQNSNLDMAPKRNCIQAEGGSSKKRARSSPGVFSPPSKFRKVKIDGSEEPSEPIDVEDFHKEQEEKAAKQAELVKQQEKEEREKPMKLASFQCIICMDNPTDLTVTHCGHLFCSFCLHEALHAGGGKKSCPVCRQEVSVKPDPTHPGASTGKKGYFPLRMKIMTANKKGKQPERV